MNSRSCPVNPTRGLHNYYVATVDRHVPQDDTQDDTQGDTQELDKMIMREIRRNPRVSTDEIAKKTNKGIATIKRHIAKLPNIKYVGSGYSGHWEIVDT